MADPRNLVQQLKTEFPGKTVTFHKVDVTKKSDIQHAFNETVKEFGCVDVMVNGAGIIKESSIEDTLHVNLVCLN